MPTTKASATSSTRSGKKRAGGRPESGLRPFSKHPSNEYRRQVRGAGQEHWPAPTPRWMRGSWYTRCNGDKQAWRSDGNLAARPHQLRRSWPTRRTIYFPDGGDNLEKVDTIATKTPHRKVKGTAYFLLKRQRTAAERHGFKEGGELLLSHLPKGTTADVPLYGVVATTVGGKRVGGVTLRGAQPH